MTEQNEAYTRLINILKELFQLDQADLDFGIYRIMNQKRDEITDFLENRLVAQVTTTLDEHADKDKDKLKEELTHLEKTLRDAGVDVDANEKVQTLRKQVLQADTTELQNTTFSHLTNFFKRYYKDGDFISQRRYKDDVYAIPYKGEEVKLYWANHDQYYIKTSEYFKSYRFKLRNGKWVNFELLEASTEQNNNKSQNGERKFKLAEGGIFQENGNTLTIYFTYEPMSKKNKQNKLIDQALETIKDEIPSKWVNELFQPNPTKKNKKRTLLEKHLKDYTARNTFDYFIHKDLGKFLSRELDFYVKNEILHIDDIDLDKQESYRQALQVIKAFKKVGIKIIEFLAQLEDFQKKLWLKKKFVLQSDYCITVDRIDDEFYEDIAANDEQRKEWVDLFTIDELEAYSEPLTIDFLKENSFLMVDTQFFSRDWKYKLLATLDQLDDQTSGLMINSENFQAINLLNEKHREKLDGLYLDPPYNTNASEINYKNEFKHSSWISFMENRVVESLKLLHPRSVLCITIDHVELINLGGLLNSIGLSENELGIVTILNNPSGRSTVKGVSISNEFAFFIGKTEEADVGFIPRSQEQKSQYPEKDDKGRYQWRSFMRSGGANDVRSARPKLYYPVGIKDDSVFIPDLEWRNNQWVITDDVNYDQLVYPKTDSSENTWRLGVNSAMERVSEMRFRINQKGNPTVDIKFRMDEQGILPKTVWDHKKYNSTSYGTTLVKNIFGENQKFAFPKSIYAVEDSIRVISNKDDATIMDYFAGSGTTGHAVINLNREDDGHRKYILVEMGEYFNDVTKTRILKAVFSQDWKNGEPVDREGISHMFKYLRLESYEDTLNNLKLNRTDQQQGVLDSGKIKEEYYLRYMIDIETRDSLLNTEMFKRPFGYKIEATEQNERVSTEVDLVETFNYLIGLHVVSIQMIRGYVLVTGHNNDGERILVIWRDTEKHSNQDLDEFVDKMEFNPHDSEFDFIYVNGDNNLQNIRKDEETWKVRLIEEEFHKRMFETEGL